MSANDERIYIKIDQNVLVHDRNVTLSDIASITSSNEAMVRQLKQKKVYSFLPESKTDKKIQRKKILREKICMKWGFWLWFVRS